MEVQTLGRPGVIPALPTTRDPIPDLPDGIHFGLNPDDAYHPSAALGSGDVQRLFKNASEYWWNSPSNALRPERKASAAMIFGRAVHARVLEGEGKFRSLYECAYEGPDLLVTDADVRAWIVENGNKPAPGTKGARVLQALAIDPDVPIDEVIRERAAEAGRTILRADEYNRIEISSRLIASNPDLKTAFTGGMPEVAVVWTEEIDGEPARCKGLFDYLKIRGIGDLKSTANPDEIDFPTLARMRFSRRRMDLQAAHYMRGREFIARYLAEGRVFGDHDPEWLGKVAAQEEYGFAFVFFQSTGAPSTWAASLSPGNPILGAAAQDRLTALRRFVSFRREYGDDMWLVREPVAEMDMADLPMWFGRAA